LRLPNLGRLTLHPLLSTGAGKRPSNAAGKLPAKQPKNPKTPKQIAEARLNDWQNKFFGNPDNEELGQLVLDELKEKHPGLVVEYPDGTEGLYITWLATNMGTTTDDPAVYEKCLQMLKNAKKSVEHERSKAAGPGPKKVKPALTEAQKEKQQKQKQATKDKQHAVDREAEGKAYFEGYMEKLKDPPSPDAKLLSELKKKWPEDHQLQTRHDDDGSGCCARRQDL